MAVFAPIPLPGIDNPQFKDVMDYFAAMKEMKMKAPLIAAQTQEAKAKALKSQMLADLMNKAGVLGSGSPSANPTQANQVNADSGSTSPVPSASATGNPNPQKEMLQALGVIKETPSEQEARETRTAYQKELAASDIKTMEKWNDTITATHAMTPILEDNQEIMANPTFQGMYNHPEYMGYNISWLKRFGNPEEQDLLTRVGTNAKSIFSSMGQDFKGAFREFEYKLFKAAAPDEERDTLQQMVSKTNTMLALRQLISKRLSLSNEIVRGSAGRISPSSALEIADKQINSKKIFKEINDQFHQSEKEQLAAKKFAEKQQSQKNPSQSATVTVVDPTGAEHIIDRNKLQAAMQKYPDLKVKGE